MPKCAVSRNNSVLLHNTSVKWLVIENREPVTWRCSKPAKRIVTLVHPKVVVETWPVRHGRRLLPWEIIFLWPNGGNMASASWKASSTLRIFFCVHMVETWPVRHGRPLLPCEIIFLCPHGGNMASASWKASSTLRKIFFVATWWIHGHSFLEGIFHNWAPETFVVSGHGERKGEDSKVRLNLPSVNPINPCTDRAKREA